MMKKQNFVTLWGGLLVVTGLLFMVQGRAYISVGDAEDRGWAALWAGLFALGALSFIWSYLLDHQDWWWTIIPGTTLLGLATIIAVGGFFPEAGGNWLGGFFLAMISLGFWLLYFSRAAFWWALIPGGTLLSVATLVFLSGWFSDVAIVAVMFFGMALTFALLYLLPRPGRGAIWALIPAGVLALLGLVMLFASGEAMGYLWAGLLILGGIYLLYRQNGPGQMTNHQ